MAASGSSAVRNLTCSTPRSPEGTDGRCLVAKRQRRARVLEATGGRRAGVGGQLDAACCAGTQRRALRRVAGRRCRPRSTGVPAPFARPGSRLSPAPPRRTTSLASSLGSARHALRTRGCRSPSATPPSPALTAWPSPGRQANFRHPVPRPPPVVRSSASAFSGRSTLEPSTQGLERSPTWRSSATTR